MEGESRGKQGNRQEKKEKKEKKKTREKQGRPNLDGSPWVGWDGAIATTSGKVKKAQGSGVRGKKGGLRGIPIAS